VSAVRVLHVLDHSIPLHSGYTFRTLSILKQQRALGWETLQLTSPKHTGAQHDEEEFDGFRFYRTRVGTGGLRGLPVLGQLSVVHDTQRRLEQVLQDTKPDLVHAHSPCLNGIAALRAARSRGIPVVYEVRAFWEDAAVDHGTTTEGSARYKLTRALETWVLKRADAVTTICEGLRSDILDRGVPAERVTVIPNAVDPEQFPLLRQPDRELQRQLSLERCFTLGFIGSFYAYEGLDLLIEALPQLLRIDPTTRVLLVGGGVAEPALKKRARELGVSEHVIFVGRVPHADVARYYSLIDLLVYPRKPMRLTETVTPLKPLEAMAQGRLLLASAVGGHRELITEGRTGFLFTPDKPDSLARAVERVLASRASWPAVREAARNFVEAERNWAASVARYRGVYGSLVKRGPHA
jgi:PEP-CTERM/exosortase A-associated glycosyltransferase